MKKPTLAKAKKLADEWFSLYVRLWHADIYGIVSCVTCGSKRYYKKIDNGHFMVRAHMGTRLEERNCHPQCFTCNKANQGEQFDHGKYIDARYGTGTADELRALAHSTIKLDVWDLIGISTKYRELALKEADKRGIVIDRSHGTRVLGADTTT